MHRLVALFAAVILPAGEAAPAEVARPAALDRPAITTVRAAASVLVTVTAAGRRLVAAGEQGIVLLSDDNGMTWRQARTVPVSVTLTALRFASAEAGWAVGHMGTILRTTDGGETWVRQLDGMQAADLVLQSASHSATGEGGQGDQAAAIRAARRLVDDGPDKPFLDMLVDDPERALVIGAFGLAFATADGGQSWTPDSADLDNPMQLHLYRLTRRGGERYLAGEQGLFLRAEAGQKRFARLPTPYAGTFFGVLAPAERVILLYGLRGTILRSDDDGDHWVTVPSGTQSSLTSGVVLSDGRLLLGSMSGQLIVSSDGGRSFAPLDRPAPQPIADLTQAADGAIVVVGPRGVLRLTLPATGTR